VLREACVHHRKKGKPSKGKVINPSPSQRGQQSLEFPRDWGGQHCPELAIYFWKGWTHGYIYIYIYLKNFSSF
jgi:hypothetical protein